MEKRELKDLIETFFTCRKTDVLQIINEFLDALEAEETLTAIEPMSRNYDTARSNPEINVIPGNLKDARDAIFPFFWGTDGWNSRFHLENVKGPANYASLIGSIACLLKNPNLCVDTYSQRSNELELKAVTSLANIVFYHTENPWGIFTMGGTISNLYGGKIGIEKVAPGAMKKGIMGRSLAGIVSQAAHYSNVTLAGWLGMGTDNLVSIPTDDACSMDLGLLEKELDRLYGANTLVAFVIATFGSTDAFGIDDIAGIREIIDAKAKQHGVPAPQLHVDAAAGWPLSFLNEYDTEENVFRLNRDVLGEIEQIRAKAMNIRHADSVTIDFHKMGWGHYPSSAFIVYDRNDIGLLFRSKEQIPYFSEADYRHDPALFTLECSRPAIGPYSVMASLNGIGLQGYQRLVAHALEMASYAKKQIEKLDYCKVLNLKCLGPSVVWWVLPKGRNAKRIYEDFIQGRLNQEEYRRYFSEVHRLFEKRRAALDPRKDARLSFTTCMGYMPGGLPMPAWKAVFFNPKTDAEVVRRIVQGIEDL
ncbi:MAG TPA: pyridoxal-dependent decarboxylase [Deltaproteobacteria bacterium]|nr:pyridoxal-dependent decarboxylase [Deltaproteobacteria bacterium]HPR55963.1 pyridoxal-dependent decarboxylase [Deltaproteobacteria bacterium]